MIKPVVNISKVIEPFDTVIVGLYGVLYDGRSFKTEAVEALKAMKRSGRKIVLVSNASSVSYTHLTLPTIGLV